MPTDPIKQELGFEDCAEYEGHNDGVVEFVDGVEPSTECRKKRDDMAQAMWDHVGVQLI